MTVLTAVVLATVEPYTEWVAVVLARHMRLEIVHNGELRNATSSRADEAHV